MTSVISVFLVDEIPLNKLKGRVLRRLKIVRPWKKVSCDYKTPRSHDTSCKPLYDGVYKSFLSESPSLRLLTLSKTLEERELDWVLETYTAHVILLSDCNTGIKINPNPFYPIVKENFIPKTPILFISGPTRPS